MNKKVLLHEYKRHTARRIASAVPSRRELPQSQPGGGGAPVPARVPQSELGGTQVLAWEKGYPVLARSGYPSLGQGYPVSASGFPSPVLTGGTPQPALGYPPERMWELELRYLPPQGVDRQCVTTVTSPSFGCRR